MQPLNGHDQLAHQPPPVAIVVMLTIKPGGQGEIQVQWPPEMPLDGVLQCLRTAADVVEQKANLQRGGIIPARTIPT